MSISQLFQPNAYNIYGNNIYGNFQASISGTEEDALEVLYSNTVFSPPTYTYNKVSYSVFGNCVSFQATIEILLKGNADDGDVSVKLPDTMPQAYVDVANPQICQLVLEPLNPGNYKDWWGEFNLDREIDLWRRSAVAGGPIDILAYSELKDGSTIKLTGVYFTA
jgi:hypothetical protein